MASKKNQFDIKQLFMIFKTSFFRNSPSKSSVSNNFDSYKKIQ